MLLEDDNPKGWSNPRLAPANAGVTQINLDPMSVAELHIYVEALKAEIKRAEAEIAKKGDSRAAADAFFKK